MERVGFWPIIFLLLRYLHPVTLYYLFITLLFLTHYPTIIPLLPSYTVKCYPVFSVLSTPGKNWKSIFPKISLNGVVAVFLTWLSVALFHPDVAVVLCHPGLWVQEGHAHTALSTQTSIVATAVFNGLFIELIAKPAQYTDRQRNKNTDNQRTQQVNRTINSKLKSVEFSLDLLNVLLYSLLQQLPQLHTDTIHWQEGINQDVCHQ